MGAPKSNTITQFFGIFDKLNKLQSKEGELLQRKRNGRIGGILAILMILFEIVKEAIDLGLLPFFEKLGFKIWFLITMQWSKFAEGINTPETYQIWGIVFILLGFGTYLLFRRSGFLMKDISEPFQYTIDVESFTNLLSSIGTSHMPGQNLINDYQLDLLGTDLTERLNMRINRFSLGSESKGNAKASSLSSHITISGTFSLREKSHGRWFIHVLPEIRIGDSTNASHLANPVWFHLDVREKKVLEVEEKKEKQKSKETFIHKLEPEQYRQLVEELYSSVATEIYRQIKQDLDQKIQLYPTSYYRAVALYHEANDFSQSNTIDSYDLAISTYEKALNYFNSSFALFWSKFVITLPFFWQFRYSFFHTYAKTHLGYVNAKVFRDTYAKMFGRRTVSLYDAVPLLENIERRLNTLHLKYTKRYKVDGTNRLLGVLKFPKDSWGKKILFEISEKRFARQRSLLFDAYVSQAFVYHTLGVELKANEALHRANSVDPYKCDQHANYLLAKGLLEYDLVKKISFFRLALEISPKFQMAQWNLARAMELKMRKENDLSKVNILRCIDEYNGVLQLNQGNISARYSKGFLCWIIHDYDESIKQFKAGIDVKAINKETFIGNLHYGLARAYLSKVIIDDPGDNGGDLSSRFQIQEALSSFLKAIESHPSIGSYTVRLAKFDIYNTDFDFIDDLLFSEYENYFEKVISKLELLGEHYKDLVVFVKNDFANACLNYYHRFGVKEKLERAIHLYMECRNLKPNFPPIYLNLENAYSWSSENAKKREVILAGRKYAGGWQDMLISFFNSNILFYHDSNKELESAEAKLKEAEKFEERQGEFLIDNRASGGQLQQQQQQQPLAQEFDEASKIIDTNQIAQSAIDTIEAEIKGLKKLVSEIKNNIESTLNEICNSSSFSAIVYENGIRVENLTKLLCIKNLETKLDATDLRVLNACALYAQNFLENGKQMAIETYELINKTAINDFDANLELINLKPEDENFKKNIRIEFDTWFKQDATSYTALKWTIDWYWNLSSSLEKKKIIDRSIDALSSAGKFTEGFKWPYLDLKLLLEEDILDKKEFQLKKEIYEDLMKEEPTSYKYYTSYADFLEKIEDETKIENVLLEGIVKVEDDQKHVIRRKLGKHYGENSKHKLANDQYLLIPDKIMTDNDMIEILKNYELNGDESNKTYLDGIKKVKSESEYSTICNNVGNKLYGAKNFERALYYYNEAKSYKPQEPVNYVNISMCYEQLQDNEMALKATEEGIKSPDLFEKHGLFNRRGMLHLRNKNYEKAIIDFNRARDLKPLDLYFSNKGFVLEKVASEKEVLYNYNEAIEKFKGESDDIYFNKIGLYFFNKYKYTQAVTYFNKAIQANYLNAIYHDNLGLAFERLGKYDEAEVAYQLGINKLKKDKKRLYNSLGVMYYVLKDYDNAINNYKKAIEEEGKPVYYKNLALAYEKKKDFDNAILYYAKEEKILPLGQKHPASNKIGVLKYNQGDYESSIHAYGRAINDMQALSKVPRALYYENRGLSYFQTRSLEKAEADYKLALDIISEENNDKDDLRLSDSHFIHVKLGEVYAYNLSFDKAIDYIDLAIKEAPMNYQNHYLFIKAKCLLLMDKEAEARKIHNQIIKGTRGKQKMDLQRRAKKDIKHTSPLVNVNNGSVSQIK